MASSSETRLKPEIAAADAAASAVTEGAHAALPKEVEAALHTDGNPASVLAEISAAITDAQNNHTAGESATGDATTEQGFPAGVTIGADGTSATKNGVPGVFDANTGFTTSSAEVTQTF